MDKDLKILKNTLQKIEDIKKQNEKNNLKEIRKKYKEILRYSCYNDVTKLCNHLSFNSNGICISCIEQNKTQIFVKIQSLRHQYL